MLLHSFSHQLIHSLGDASGLDRDGIGEYLFPADLAFTIYRKGMTPDLGNISAMWRTSHAPANRPTMRSLKHSMAASERSA